MADLSSLLGAAGIGGAIGKAIVSLELETTKYQAELRAAQAQTVASTNASSQAVGGFGKFASAAFLGVGVAAVAGIAVSIKAASSLNEQLNKTQEVFEDSAESVIAFSETSAESFGISQAAALSAAGSFGQIFDAAGLASDAAADMSVSLVKLASDLASFNDLDPTVALQKLQSGLAGQARPLREVGVFLSAARVEAEAYGSGIAKVGEELTDAQKIQARYNIILQDTTKAQGDFARTVGESVPNQMRKLTAVLEDTAAQFGTALLPIVLEAAKAFVEVAEALGPLLVLLGKLGPVVEGVAFVFSKLLSPLAAVISALGDGVQPTEEMVDVMGSAVIAIESMKQKAALADAELRGLTAGTKKAGDAVKKTTEDFEDLHFTLEDVADSTDVSRREFITYFRTLERNARDLRDAARELRDEKWLDRDFVDFLSAKGPQWIIEFSDLNERQQRRWQESWDESNRRTKNANDNLDTIRTTLDRLDKSESKHQVIIEYKYVGYDPSKPGMSQGVGGKNNTPSELQGG